MPPMRHDVANSAAVLPSIADEVVLLGAVDVEEVLQLEHLPAAQLADRGREQRATSAPSDAASDDARASRKSPARIATMLLHRAFTLGDAAPGLGLVDDVVVVERAQVHELARHRRR